jgi:hypothetical protein
MAGENFCRRFRDLHAVPGEACDPAPRQMGTVLWKSCASNVRDSRIFAQESALRPNSVPCPFAGADGPSWARSQVATGADAEGPRDLEVRCRPVAAPGPASRRSPSGGLSGPARRQRTAGRGDAEDARGLPWRADRSQASDAEAGPPGCQSPRAACPATPARLRKRKPAGWRRARRKQRRRCTGALPATTFGWSGDCGVPKHPPAGLSSGPSRAGARYGKAGACDLTRSSRSGGVRECHGSHAPVDRGRAATSSPRPWRLFICCRRR